MSPHAESVGRWNACLGMPGSFNAGTRKKDYGQIKVNKLRAVL